MGLALCRCLLRPVDGLVEIARQFLATKIETGQIVLRNTVAVPGFTLNLARYLGHGKHHGNDDDQDGEKDGEK